MVGVEVSKTLICSSCRKKGNTASEVCIILITGNQEKIFISFVQIGFTDAKE